MQAYFASVSKRYTEIADAVNDMTFTESDVIVLDIDETVLCTLCDKKEYADFFKIEHSDSPYRHCPPLPDSIAFVKALHAKCPRIYFVSARDESLRSVTIQDLKCFEPYSTLYLRPLYSDSPVAVYKSHTRQIISKTWNIKVCIGDQKIDVADFTEHSFLIPNPFYVIV